MDRLFRLVHWLSITLFLRKTNLDCISLEQESGLVYFSAVHYTREESGEETLWTLKNWRRWTHQNSTPEGAMQRQCYRRGKVTVFFFPSRRWTSANLRVRTASENIHLNLGCLEERNKKFFEENQMNYTLQHHFKKTQRGVKRKLKVTSGLLQENSFIVITLNPEPNCTYRKKNHFLFH